MNPGSIVKFRPQGPWRIGPNSGARDRVDTVYHGDSLYSAVTNAMLALGMLEEWLDSTVRNPAGAAIRFSSCFPFHGETRFVVPPRSVWPGSASPKVRWKGARFIPLTLVEALLKGGLPEEDRWSVDGQSECLVPHGRPGPFRIGVRSSAAVDRMGSGIEPHTAACLEFHSGAGLWSAIWFADDAARERWRAPVESAFRLLADSGFGGERSRGWGRTESPEFTYGLLPNLILSPPAPETIAAPTEAIAAPGASEADSFWLGPSVAPAVPQTVSLSSAHAYWLLSLFTPNPEDPIDWERGSYELVARGGRVESPARSGVLKKLLNMVAEGSVLVASGELRGSAADVSPDGFPHPVYRAGFAVAIPIPQVTT
jgi:CRISPR type III-A-associated RAMP protein Csm4